VSEGSADGVGLAVGVAADGDGLGLADSDGEGLAVDGVGDGLLRRGVGEGLGDRVGVSTDAGLVPDEPDAVFTGFGRTHR